MFQPDNTDQAAGYEIGRKLGRERFCGMIRDREPPKHFDWSRRAQWRVGYDAGIRERERRITIAVWSDPTNGATRSKMYRGHASRSRIVSRLAAKGVCGDVIVSYHDGGKMISEHRCGI